MPHRPTELATLPEGHPARPVASLPVGSAATSHILKPAMSGFDDHDLNEHRCLRAAALAELPAVRSEVVSFGGETAVQIERYDRLRAGRALVLIHQEDACQALGVAPTAKYQSDGGPGPADIAALFRRTMPAQIAQAAVRRSPTRWCGTG